MDEYVREGGCGEVRPSLAVLRCRCMACSKRSSQHTGYEAQYWASTQQQWDEKCRLPPTLCSRVLLKCRSLIGALTLPTPPFYFSGTSPVPPLPLLSALTPFLATQPPLSPRFPFNILPSLPSLRSSLTYPLPIALPSNSSP